MLKTRRAKPRAEAQEAVAQIGIRTPRANLKSESAKKTARAVAVHIVYFISGVVVSRGAMLGSVSPFGASFAAAVPFSCMPAGLLGAGIGYLFMSPVDSFRYIAIIISVGALRWVFNELKRVSDSRLFAPAVAFVPVLFSGAALTFTSSSELTELSLCLIEALLSAAGAYFMSRTSALAYLKRGMFSFSQTEIACIAMTGCIMILSLSSLTVGNVSVGRILAMMVVMIAARYGFVAGGSIAGVATGIIFSLSDSKLLFLCAAYALSGLLSGLFAPLGKLSVALTTLVCSLAVSAVTRDHAMMFAILLEGVIAGSVFMLLPKELGSFMSAVFSNSAAKASEDAVRQNITMRLSHCSRALSGVSSCVSSVSEKLSRLYSPNAWWIYDKASERTCLSCGLRAYCWERQKEMTVDDFHRLTDTLRQNGFVKERDIEENFLKRCCKTTELADNINKSYKDYRSLKAASKRVAQVRTVVADQFSGLSQILEDLAVEFEGCESFDADAAERVTDALRSLGITVVDCSVRKSLGRGTVVEVVVVAGRKTALSKTQLTREISKACGRFFETPSLSFEGERVRITLCERALYDVEIGSAQHIANDGELCGDCINYFHNGEGSVVAILSDGMGCGGRAAVDSNMAVSILTKLLKAGLSYDCALAVVNSSLMVKSEDESMATMDVVDFNLFTGKAAVRKAGACTTYIKRSGALIKKDLSSLPIGILSQAKFVREDVALKEGDFIVMVSDGVLSGNEEWLERMVTSFQEASAADLATNIVNEARLRRREMNDDDITALALKVVLNT